MNFKQELERFKTAVKRRENSKQNALIATIIDSSPHTQYGFVTGKLDDDTIVNIQCWTNLELTAGQKCFILPISGQPWNWYLLLQLNNSTDLEATPFTPPDVSTIPSHTLDSHSGNLNWNRINTASSKVDLAAQVTGSLPVANQVKQTTVQTITIVTGTVGASATETGSVTGPKCGYVRSVSLTGGSSARVAFYETSAGTQEYGMNTTSTPYVDNGGWFHYESDGISQLHYGVTNGTGTPDIFTVTLQIVAWEL